MIEWITASKKMPILKINFSKYGTKMKLLQIGPAENNLKHVPTRRLRILKRELEVEV